MKTLLPIALLIALMGFALGIQQYLDSSQLRTSLAESLSGKDSEIRRLNTALGEKTREAADATTLLKSKIDNLVFDRYSDQIQTLKSEYETRKDALTKELSNLVEKNARLSAIVEQQDIQLKRMSIVVNPYIEYKRISTLFNNTLRFALGYQYQLFYEGLPVMAQAIVVTQRADEKLLSPIEQMLVELTRRAAETAAAVVAGFGQKPISIIFAPNVISIKLPD